ncbi:hypothetical protein FKM82_022157 [Ascaphus truei]
MEALHQLKQFDAYPKTLDDFRVKTCGGAVDLGKAEEETVFDPTSLDPERCESCYGAETEDIRCCNSCDDVREAYRRKGWAFKTPDSIAQCKREGSARRWKSRGTRAAKCTGF